MKQRPKKHRNYTEPQQHSQRLVNLAVKDFELKLTSQKLLKNSTNRLQPLLNNNKKNSTLFYQQYNRYKKQKNNHRLPYVLNNSEPHNHIKHNLNHLNKIDNKKNAFFLNSLIQILKPSEQKNRTKAQSHNQYRNQFHTVQKQLKLDKYKYTNEFFDLNEISDGSTSTKNYRGPKIMETQMTKLSNHNNILRRKITSEKKPRKIPDEELKYTQPDKLESVQILTFFNKFPINHDKQNKEEKQKERAQNKEAKESRENRQTRVMRETRESRELKQMKELKETKQARDYKNQRHPQKQKMDQLLNENEKPRNEFSRPSIMDNFLRRERRRQLRDLKQYTKLKLSHEQDNEFI